MEEFVYILTSIVRFKASKTVNAKSYRTRKEARAALEKKYEGYPESMNDPNNVWYKARYTSTPDWKSILSQDGDLQTDLCIHKTSIH